MNAPNDYKLKPEHSGCLTAWLTVSVLAAIVVIFFLSRAIPIAQIRGMRTFVYILIGASVFNIVFIGGIFDWRRWGVIGFVATIIGSAVLQIITGLAAPRDVIAPFVQIGLLYYLIHDKWHYYD